jgi:hypothetical protein
VVINERDLKSVADQCDFISSSAQSAARRGGRQRDVSSNITRNGRRFHAGVFLKDHDFFANDVRR